MPDDKATPEQLRKLKLDEQLDRELEQTFPASDAPTITQSGSCPAPVRDGHGRRRGS